MNLMVKVHGLYKICDDAVDAEDVKVENLDSLMMYII